MSGPLEISGQMAALASDPATASAMSAVMSTPQFSQLRNQHALAMGLQSAPAQPSSGGGPGVAYGGQPVVQERQLRDTRALALGFFQPGIGLGTNFNVTSRPQVLFRGERLVIPDSPAYPGQTGATQADSFLINDIKIGNKSQLVEATSLPARAFAENAVGVRLSLDTASIAQDVVVAVSNVDITAATFRAVLFGTSAF
jgi:hypothetical protein